MSGDDVKKTVAAPHSPGPFLWFYSHRFLFKKAPQHSRPPGAGNWLAAGSGQHG